VAIVVAAFMIVVMGLAAIVIDLGFARDRVRVAQNAADATALAVAICYSAPAGCPDPQGTAQGYATANGWSYDPSAVSIDTTAQTVTVSLPTQTNPGFFAGALGFSNARVGAAARATWGGSAAVTCALCVLGNFGGQIGDVTLAGSLAVNGNLDFNNGGGTVTITTPTAGAAVLVHGTVNRGTYTVNGGRVVPVPVTTTITDPLAGRLTLPPPSGAEGVNLGTTATSGSGGVCIPGNYIDFSRCSSLQGNGIYIVTGPASARGGAVEIPAGTAPNTLVYLTCNDGANKPKDCSQGQKGAYLGGNGRFNSVVNGRTIGAYKGYAVIYDPKNSPDQNDARVSGNSSLTLNGNLYAASAAVDFRGNGAMTVDGFAVVGQVTLSGNGLHQNHIDVGAHGVPQTIGAVIPPHLIP